ncbi:MAG: hypothetical protein JRJ60_23395, partial [Deltaproteobacteria bacterium]|nr:hypothetical protein [Deltaproteobacteria bacterium]
MILAIVFFVSGGASLVYQVAWQRLLTLHYGVGSVSITLIVSVYMFGLGVGALAGGWLGERVHRRIGLYVLIELLMGCFGLLSLPFLSYLGRSTAGSGYGWSLASMALFLSLPTFLMGMTLPLLTKIFNAVIRDFPRTVSFLYFINTLGAAAGCMAAGYGLISFWGLDRSVHAAAAANLVLAGLIYVAGRIAPKEKYQGQIGPAVPVGAYSLGRMAYLLVFVTGFLAIGYEIVWFRVVGVLVKASPYAFSTSLSVYLAGIAFGSLWMNRRIARRPLKTPKDLFFLLQFLVALAVLAAFTGYDVLTRHTDLAVLTRKSFAAVLHPGGGAISLASLRSFFSGLYRWADVLFWPGVFMFVPTLMMGASFPLLAAMAPAGHEKEAKSVGTIYFFNICGNVLGGVLTGFLLLTVLGTEHTLLLFISAGMFLGLFTNRIGGKPLKPLPKAGLAALIAASLVLFFPGTGMLYRTLHTPPWPGSASVLDEGVEGVVMTFWKGDRVRTYINGLAHGGRPNYGFYYETIEALSHAP